jgi:PAS domain S-box-containing protein
MKLSVKFGAIFIITSMFIIVAVGIIVYNRLLNERLSLVNEMISIQIRDFDFALENFFTDVEGDIYTLSENDTIRSRDDTFFTSFLHADADTFSYNYSPLEKSIIKIFNTYRQKHPFVNSVYMGRENGTFVRSHPREAPSHYDPRMRPWYILAKNNPGKIMKTDAYHSVTTNDINIGVVRALSDSRGIVYGVVGIDITIDNLTRYLLGFKALPSYRFFLIDRNGMVLAGHERGLVGKNIERYSPELGTVSRTDNNDRTIRIGNQNFYLFSQKSGVQDWKIVVLAPTSDIKRQIRGPILVIIAILSAGLMLLGALFFVNFKILVLRPLEILTVEIDAITSTGDLDRRIEIGSHDEFGKLALSYNSMIVSLEWTQNSLRKAEKAVRSEHQELESVIEFLPDATFVTDRDKRIVAWNRACEDLTGIPKCDILGKNYLEYPLPLFNEHHKLLIDYLDLPSSDVEGKFQEIKKTGNILTSEIFIGQLRNGDGAYLWCAATALFDQDGVKSGAIEVIRDVTDLKRYEQALVRSEKNYRELVEHVNSIILRWKPDGQISFLNEYGQRFFGYSEEEILGKSIIDTIVPESDSSGMDLHELMKRISADPAAFEQNVNENRRRNGEHVWIAWTNRVVKDESGQIHEILSVGTDITRLKKAEDAVNELNADLERRVTERTTELDVAKSRAEESDRLKSAFLATMSHELRTPLNSIIGFTGVILQGLAGPLTNEQEKQMNMVRNSAQHLLSLINDVLDISKIEAGQLQVFSDTFNLAAIAEKVIETMMPLSDRKGLSLHNSISMDIGEVVADRRRVEQIMINLVSNAIKYTEKGDISVIVSPYPVKRDGDPPCFRFSVTDTGIGIREEDMKDLFRPFRQIDTGLSRMTEGTGLGLAICRRLANLMGGEITAESKWGKGSTFSFIFPTGGNRSNEKNHTSH